MGQKSRQMLWFVAIWATSIIALGAVSLLIKAVLA